MEPIPENACMICFEIQKTASDLITFSCNHTFCTKCSPYLLLNNLRNLDFNLKNEYLCPQCFSGKATILLEKFNEGLAETDRTLDQSLTNLQCICSKKEILSHMCLSCQRAICSFCFNSEHKNHEMAPMGEFGKKFQEGKQEKLKFLSESIRNTEEPTTFENQELINQIDRIVSDLQKLKEKAVEDAKFFVSQNELIKSVYKMAHQQMNQKDLHPNKQFLISNALEGFRGEREKSSQQFMFDETVITELIGVKKTVECLKEIRLEVIEKKK